MVRLWDRSRGLEIRHHPASARYSRTLAFSPCGDRYAYTDGHAVHVRSTGDGAELATFQHEAEIECVVFTPDGQGVATSAGLQDLLGSPVDTTARLWRLP
jgi:WD40 repeat protein